MSTATVKTEINGAPSTRAKDQGNAGTVSDSEQFKPCQHVGQGCISQNGYGCLHDGAECKPMDNNGHEFTVREWKEDGTRMTTKDYKPERPRPTITEEHIGNKVCCQQGKIGCMCQPEDHAGKGACGKIINADSPNAPAQVREQCLARMAEIRAGPHTVRTVH